MSDEIPEREGYREKKKEGWVLRDAITLLNAISS